MAVSVVLMLLFYALCFGALLCDGGAERFRRARRALSPLCRVALALIVAAFTVFVVYWPRQDRFVYFWDYSYYWNMSINRMNFMRENTVAEILRTLYQSINENVYNAFLPTLLALPLQIFGYAFPTYATLCCVLFLLPALFVQGMIVMKLAGPAAEGKGWLYVFSVAAALCVPVNYYSAFHGYLDVAFLLPLSCVMYLFVDYDFRKISPVRNVVIALLLVLIWICRRYTVFFLIGFAAAMGVKALAVILRDKSLKRLKAIAANLLMIGGISGGVLFVCFREFIMRALTNNYSEAYSVYSSTLSGKIWGVVSAYGMVAAALILVAAALCAARRRHMVNMAALLVMIVAEMVSFWQIQDMGIQHVMILSVPVFTMCAMIPAHWADGEGRFPGGKPARRAAPVVNAAVILVNFAMAFAPQLPTAGCGTLFSERYQPFRRDDIGALHALVDALNANASGRKKSIYVAASGEILNQDILEKIDMPENSNAMPRLYRTSNIDLQDGFPVDFLQAKLVVATNPVQTHLASGQEVVIYLSTLVQDPDSYIGRHFECVGQIELDAGVVAGIYRKIDEFTAEDRQQLRDYFTALYPDHTDIFADRIR